MRAIAARMDDALGNALVIEVEDLLAEMGILEQCRPARALLRSVFWSSGDRHRPAAWSAFDAHCQQRLHPAASRDRPDCRSAKRRPSSSCSTACDLGAAVAGRSAAARAPEPRSSSLHAPDG
jgi:hypothetical protein